MISSHYRGKGRNLSGPQNPEQHLPFRVVLGTLGGGIVAAAIAFEAHQKSLALGLGLGCLAASLNFLGLRILAEKVLKAGELRGRKIFWYWTILRWFGFAIVCWALLLISDRCLWGGMAGYIWFLFVLTLTGLKFARPVKNGAP